MKPNLATLFLVFLSLAIIVLADLCAPDPRVAKIQNMRGVLAEERSRLIELQRELAAYDAINKTVADEIQILQTTSK